VPSRSQIRFRPQKSPRNGGDFDLEFVRCRASPAGGPCRGSKRYFAKPAPRFIPMAADAVEQVRFGKVLPRRGLPFLVPGFETIPCLRPISQRNAFAHGAVRFDKMFFEWWCSRNRTSVILRDVPSGSVCYSTPGRSEMTSQEFVSLAARDMEGARTQRAPTRGTAKRL
jgi:hypothetical protein